LFSSETGEKGSYLALCDIKTRLNSMHVVLVRYGERDGCGLNDLHAKAMFIRAQPINHCRAIRVELSEIL
jgi:hypothetical protein